MTKRIWLLILLILATFGLLLPIKLVALDSATVDYIRPPSNADSLAVLTPDYAVAEQLYQDWLNAENQRKEKLRNKSGGYDPCSCVSYAKYKSGINVGSIGAAKNHPINANLPAIGAIVVMRVNSQQYANTGHLAVVTAIDGDYMTVSEANYVHCKVTTRKLLTNDYTVRGYYILQ